MNPYTMLSSSLDTREAAALSARLSAWHDAMVAHERRLRLGQTTDICDDECPHIEARALWAEASAILGPRANELTFLRSRALRASASSNQRAVSAKTVSQDAGTVRGSSAMRSATARRPSDSFSDKSSTPRVTAAEL